MNRWLLSVLAVGLLAVATDVAAQGAKTYKTRLSPVPVAAFNANVIGTGTVTATLTGSKLAISGSYEGLASNATIAKIYKSAKPGMRGDAILDLSVTGGASGTISGQFDLSAPQIQELAGSRYYVQLSSEKAADGNLWGWLMPQQEKAR